MWITRRTSGRYARAAVTALALVTTVSLASCERRTSSSSTRSNEIAPTEPVAADNTANNRGDAAAAAKTPMTQSEASSDIKITAAIRSAILDDKTMSLNARNCKIITEKNGVVTLRGAVDTQAERTAIEAKARGVAGVASVDNQLEVKSS